MKRGMTSGHHAHLAAGAVMGTVADWEIPLRFADPSTEAETARQGVALAEQGHLTKIRLQGPGVHAALDRLSAAGEVGRVASVPVPRVEGLVEFARLTQDEAWLVASPGVESALLAAIDDDGVAAFDLTSSFSAARLVGPNAARVIAFLSDLDLRDKSLPDGTCAQTMLAEVYGLVIRADVAGLPSYRLFYGREYGVYVWESLMEAGEACGLVLMGSETLDALGASP